MGKVIQEAWEWLFSIINKAIMEGFTKKMTFRLEEREEISPEGRTFRAAGARRRDNLSGKTGHVDGDAVKWELGWYVQRMARKRCDCRASNN